MGDQSHGEGNGGVAGAGGFPGGGREDGREDIQHLELRADKGVEDRVRDGGSGGGVRERDDFDLRDVDGGGTCEDGESGVAVGGFGDERRAGQAPDGWGPFKFHGHLDFD